MEEIITLTIAPAVMGLVQAIKVVAPRTARYAIPMSLIFATLFAVLLVDWSEQWQLALLSLTAITVQIATSASGIYSYKSDKKENPAGL